MCVCVCVYVCVRERGSEKEREQDRKIDRMCVCLRGIYIANIYCNTFNISMPVAGWINRVFTNPESTTYFIPDIVTEVSAMFVDRTNFLTPGDEGAKARI